MDEIIYKVFISCDINKCITDVWSTGNISLGDTRTIEEMQELGYVQIDEGTDGEIYGRAQVNYLIMKYGKPTYDEQNRCNFRYVDKVEKLNEEEKQKLFPPIQPQPTEQDKINAMILKEIAKLKAGA